MGGDRIVDEASDPGGEVRPAWAHPIDAIVLAGTHRNPRRLIGSRNKAFLELEGRPLVRHVVDALVQSRSIDRIFVVGPAGELKEALGDLGPRVQAVQQQGKMLTNSWAAIHASESRHAHLGEEAVSGRPLLIISSDLPLISPRAIDDFVARCAAIDRNSDWKSALLAGVAEEAGLRPYYPAAGKPGIKRPYVELSSGRLRLANIYVARPRKLAHQDFLQTGFSYRKAKDWRNVLMLVFNFFKQPGGWQAAWLTIRCQVTLMVSKGQGRFYRWMRSGNTLPRVEKSVSAVLGGPVKVVVTPFGGLSLDVDEEEDYRILSERYSDWMAIHNAVET